MIDFDKHLKIAVKSGTIEFGIKHVMKVSKSGKSKLLIISSDCPEQYKNAVVTNSKSAGIPIYFYHGTSLDMGIACEKPFMISALSVKNEGNSEILKLVDSKNVDT